MTCRAYIEKTVVGFLHQFYDRALFERKYVECQKIGRHIDKILDAMESNPCQN